MGADFMRKINKPFTKRYDLERANLNTRDLLSKSPLVAECRIKATRTGEVVVGDSVQLTITEDRVTVSKDLMTVGQADPTRTNLASETYPVHLTAKVVSENPYCPEMTLSVVRPNDQS